MGLFSKIKSSFSSQKEHESEVDPSYVEGIIHDIDNEPFATSQSNVMYAGLGEIAGYHLLQTVTVGTLRIKTITGAQLKIKGTDFELNLNSDMVEIESEDSDSNKMYVTKIDFEIDLEDLPKIKKLNIESLMLSCKKEQIPFSIVHVLKNDEEE